MKSAMNSLVDSYKIVQEGGLINDFPNGFTTYENFISTIKDRNNKWRDNHSSSLMNEDIAEFIWFNTHYYLFYKPGEEIAYKIMNFDRLKEMYEKKEVWLNSL